MNRVRAYTEMVLRRLNRLARAAHIGTADADWLETERSEHSIPYQVGIPQLTSKLQDIYALKAVEERLKS